jgi:hypothetical protein
VLAYLFSKLDSNFKIELKCPELAEGRLNAK